MVLCWVNKLFSPTKPLVCLSRVYSLQGDYRTLDSDHCIHQPQMPRSRHLTGIFYGMSYKSSNYYYTPYITQEIPNILSKRWLRTTLKDELRRNEILTI